MGKRSKIAAQGKTHASGKSNPKSDQRPNVLLICVDQWPGLLRGAAGHDLIQTPTLDQLCRNGVHFTQAYSETPTCIPARRELMTGTTARTHGDRVYSATMRMRPELPTLAQTFRDHGYQAYAVGKMHVYPQRDRIGFDDVLLNEEGRNNLGMLQDDFQRFLAEEGYAGQELTHGMCNNEYTVRPWHLPEYCHPTNWTAREMCRVIRRRDPTRPAFWYCSFIAPHPPVTPPAAYLEMYRDIGVDDPFIGDWASDFEALPHALRRRYEKFRIAPMATRLARQGFYAQCTYVDHQLRLVLGALSEEKLMDNTIILFTGDHGDMLGNHNLWCKPPMHEYSAKIPMILVPTADYKQAGHHQADDRLCSLRDVMPTLLGMCGLPVPGTVEGASLLGPAKRDHLYCEHYENDLAMRMIRAGSYKLIWYPVGNRFHLFDLTNDPHELRNLAGLPEFDGLRGDLEKMMLRHLYGTDKRWVRAGRLAGEPDRPFAPEPNRSLTGQRGWR